MYGDQFGEFVSGYWINSELESFLNAFTHTQNAPVEVLHALYLNLKRLAGPTFSSFNPCPSLHSAATDDRKQFQCLNYTLK